MDGVLDSITASSRHFRRLPQLSARVLLSIAGLVALIPGILFGAYAIYTLTEHNHGRQKVALQEMARAIVRSVDGELHTLEQLAKVLAGSTSLVEGNFTSFERLARDAANTAKYDIVLIDEDYRQIVNTALQPGHALPVTRNSSLVERVFRSGETVVSEVVKRTSDGELTIGVLVPAEGTGKRYVLVLTASLDLLGGIFDRVPLPEGWVAAIDDPKGTISARSVDPERYVGEKARLQTPQGGTGVTHFIDLQDRPSVMSYAVSSDTRFRAVVWAPEDIFYASSRTLTGWFIAVAMVALVATLGVGVLAGQFLHKPLTAVVRSAHMLGDGVEPRPVRSAMREANILGQALQDAATNIAAREDALRSEAQKNLLLARELAHRTKNIMAVTLAIARQSGSGSMTAEEFCSVFEGRIASLARSLDLLVEEEWVGVSLEALIREQISPFGEYANIELSGPECLLNPQAVQYLGMAFFELGTNAAKYGAFATPEGKLRVWWSLEDDTLAINWREMTPAAHLGPQGKGFGQAVLEILTPASLSGSAELRGEPSGWTWSLVAPASSVLRSSDPPRGSAKA